MPAVMQQVLAAGGGAPVSSIAFHAEAADVSGTLTFPAGTQAGDFAVLVNAAAGLGAGSADDVVPAGWTPLATAAVDTSGTIINYRIRSSCKVLTSADVAAGSVTGMNESSEAGVMLVFRPTGQITNAIASSWEVAATTGNPSSQTVSAAGQSAPLVVIGSVASNLAASFSTASPAFDATITDSTSFVVGYKIYNASPADHTIDADDLGDVTLLTSGYVRFS